MTTRTKTATKTTARRPKAQDATLINIDSLKKRVAKLERNDKENVNAILRTMREVGEHERRNNELSAKVQSLEAQVAKLLGVDENPNPTVEELV